MATNEAIDLTRRYGADRAGRRISTYSRGTHQRLGLAFAVLLLLDAATLLNHRRTR